MIATSWHPTCSKTGLPTSKCQCYRFVDMDDDTPLTPDQRAELRAAASAA